ncbi:killer cell lectin-like receptor subfamily B member 1 isoform X1 [Mirounga angustirostris]|uniref:killer cell lectin-like receptor subfamily B member 1 isoform X1 n=1 Tax=Mirounga angustirostris TaxID=9716 RepID=UPI00313C2156
MDRQVVYADLNLSRGSCFASSSPPSFPQDVCQGSPWHQFALKLGCIAIILLTLTVIGLSVSVTFLRRNSLIEESRVDVQENRNETTEKLDLLKCPEDWHILPEKCLFLSRASNTWKDSLTDCSTKESSLLLIRDQEELKLIRMRINEKGMLFWIGLNLTLSEKKWKWINGSFLNSNVFLCKVVKITSRVIGGLMLHRLQITGYTQEKSCVSISPTRIISEDCDTENRWICQKELKPVRNKAGSTAFLADIARVPRQNNERKERKSLTRFKSVTCPCTSVFLLWTPFCHLVDVLGLGCGFLAMLVLFQPSKIEQREKHLKLMLCVNYTQI